MRSQISLFGMGALLLATTGAVQGATIVVPNDELTIQAAVDVALGGDTIKVLPGVYFENVTVPPGKDGLRILGPTAKSVTVDALPLAPTGSGPGFLVRSNNVTIGGMTIRNARPDGGLLEGDGILCEATGCTLQGLALVGNDEDGADITGHNALITQCTFSGNEDSGLELDGNNAEITRNISDHAGEVGYRLHGDNLLIENNKSKVIDDGAGFEVHGADNRILGNRAEIGTGDGFLITCSGSCSGLRIQKNLAFAISDDDEGFDIFVAPGSGTSWVVEKNVARDNVSHGFLIHGSGGLIFGNKALHNGTESEHGFFIVGDGNEISSNQAVGNDADGFRVVGNANIIANNKAVENMSNGIHLDSGADNTIFRNFVTKSLGDGIRNDGTDTILTSNTSGKNRKDCTSDLLNGASVLMESGNKCADGSIFSLTFPSFP
ncbi:MAG: right-handed parallel beta-helix repeat-containing protein [Deltaproteobacteria bacterium]|nr:right-handed parallel beta-helix repeat-containing protein [Deltaproteobacteria bacterium]